MFRGNATHTLDAKGRVSLPANFREILAERAEGKEANEVILTETFDACLRLYPKDVWESFEQTLHAQPKLNESIQALIRVYIGQAKDLQLDKNGRMLIPQEFRTRLKLNGESNQVVWVGSLDTIELWNKEDWDAYLTRESDNKEKLAAEVAKLGL